MDGCPGRTCSTLWAWRSPTGRLLAASTHRPRKRRIIDPWCVKIMIYNFQRSGALSRADCLAGYDPCLATD
eukprot:1647355-Heterocapsa_arctica.AAC.1